MTYPIVAAVLLLCVHAFVAMDHSVSKHLVNLHRQTSFMTPQSREKFQKNLCSKLRLVFKRKELVLRRLHATMKKHSSSNDLVDEERDWKTKTFTIFEEELNDGEYLIYEAMNWLIQALTGNFKDFLNIKKSSQVRLEVLHDAVLKEQREYEQILEAEKDRDKDLAPHTNSSNIEKVIDGILSDVAKAADELEKDLSDHAFDKAVAGEKGKGGGKVEAVVRLPNEEDTHHEDEDSKNKKSNSTKKAPKNNIGMKLVDSHDNQYVMSKPKDSTVPHEDRHFIQDVIAMVFISFIVSWLCTLIYLPSMFGYVIGGVILGPSGFNFIKSTIQVETLGEFGVFFILFMVGLEFSPEKLKRVWKVAVFGSTSMMTVMVGVGLLLGNSINSTANESAFIAACLSLSSTPLIVKFLSENKSEKDDGLLVDKSSQKLQVEEEHGPILMGILVMQDVLLGVLIALLPIIAGYESQDGGTMQDKAVMYLLLTAKLIGAFVVILFITWLLATYVVGGFFQYFLSKNQKETTVLAAVVLAFAMLMITDWLGISMELGCFLAGVIISAQGVSVAHPIECLMEPVKDFLACIFFCSIGLHVFPSFLLFEITVLTTLTLAVVGFKFFTSLAVLHVLLSSSVRPAKWMVSAGLAQVSEFAFVLGSRARRLGLISREVYLLVLGLTTLSLILAPALWQITSWQLHLHMARINKAKLKRSNSIVESDVTKTTLDDVKVEQTNNHQHTA